MRKINIDTLKQETQTNKTIIKSPQGGIQGGFACALFDMDGVLYDSMKNHVIAYQESLKKFGYEMPAEEVYLCEGMKGNLTMKDYLKKAYNKDISIEEADVMYEEKCKVFRSLPKAEKIPGVEHFMHTLKDAGLQICVVTGSGQRSLLDGLVDEFPGLIDKDHIVCSFDYKNGKPAPDPYLIGLEKCHCTADEAIVIENAPLGVRAGRAAGIYTLAVNTGPLTRDYFERADASQIFDNMSEAEAWFLQINKITN